MGLRGLKKVEFSLLNIVHTFRKISLCYGKLIKKISLNFELGAGVKLIFENREFSCFSMGVRISKIHNSKTIRDKKFLIFTSNWVFSSYLMSWYQNLKNPKFLKQYIVHWGGYAQKNEKKIKSIS